MSIERATFGGGCFWCLEAVFNRLKGVQSVVSGYSGGVTKDPTYQEVCGGKSEHAEVIQITFDSEIISFSVLVDIFFLIHDPTALNRQGNDIGTQYRSIIFYEDDEQRLYAERTISELDAENRWSDPIVTEVKPLVSFYNAERYHQGFYKNNPDNQYCSYLVPPKLEKIKKYYKEYFL